MQFYGHNIKERYQMSLILAVSIFHIEIGYAHQLGQLYNLLPHCHIRNFLPPLAFIYLKLISCQNNRPFQQFQAQPSLMCEGGLKTKRGIKKVLGEALRRYLSFLRQFMVFEIMSLAAILFYYLNLPLVSYLDLIRALQTQRIDFVLVWNEFEWICFGSLKGQAIQ